MLATLVVALVATTKPVEAAFPGQNGKIAFSTSRDGNSGFYTTEIYTMNADGSNQTRLTNAVNDDYFPDWQPNTAPTIISLRPPPGSATTDRTPTIAATVTDQQTNLAKSNITLVLDDVTILRSAFSYNQSTDRMTYTPEKKLSFGKHALKVIAQDGSGLSTTKRWSFEIVHS